MENSEKKRIMLVSDFYYGRFEGDRSVRVEKTNTTFKCQSCLKILKNNIRWEGILLPSVISSFVYHTVDVWNQFVCFSFWVNSWHHWQFSILMDESVHVLSLGSLKMRNY